MRTNPFNDIFLFLIGDTNDHMGSGARWLLVALFWMLLFSSIWIARRNWLSDPAQRTNEHLATWFMRVLIGCMWFEGSLWKLPLPVSGAFNYWTGELAEYAAFGLHQTIAKSIYLPFLAILNPIVYLTELSLAVSFMLGFLVRPMAAVGMLFTLHIYFGLYRHPHEWPWLYIFLIFVQGFFLVHAAGRSLGLDALLRREPVGPFAGDGRLATLYRKVS